jgi:cbb3-type cytochrome oxidase cytochrome c subunit
MVPESNMPNYVWLYQDPAEVGIAADKMRVLKKLGVPYTDEQLQGAAADYDAQATLIVDNLLKQGVNIQREGQSIDDAKREAKNLEITALIGYLMRLGKNLEPAVRTAETGGR